MSDGTLYVRHESDAGRVTYKPFAHWPLNALGAGLWMVQVRPGCRRATSLQKLADLPDPMPAAALMRHSDVIAATIGDLMRRWQEGEAMSPASWTDEIIAAVARKEAADAG